MKIGIVELSGNLRCFGIKKFWDRKSGKIFSQSMLLSGENVPVEHREVLQKNVRLAMG